MDNFIRIKILVVDSDEATRDVLSAILRKAGYNVLTAPTGVAARRILAQERIDMVMSDLRMPDMQGLDLLKEVKSRFPDIAVIAIAAQADSYTIKDALMQGADEYITKPLRSWEVTMVVERAYWRLMSGRRQVEGI